MSHSKTDATAGDPTGGGAAGNNMVKVLENVYDGGLPFLNRNLTRTTAYAGAGDGRLTNFTYDFRNRRVATQGELDFYETYAYDNADRVIGVDRRNTSATGLLIARNETAYDARGRVYQTLRYGVDPVTGTVGHALSELTWYNPAGQVMKQRSQEGGGFEKLSYDGVGRVTKRFVACRAEDETYAQASSVTDNFVLEQNFYSYDDAGNATAQTNFERNHDDEGTGALAEGAAARVSFAASYPDALGRAVAVADYGTHGGAAWTRSELKPAASNTCLVTLTRYDSLVDIVTTDPKGTARVQSFDAAGRLSSTTENFRASFSGPDVNKTTIYTYTLDGQLSTLTARNSVTGNQVTRWVYGTTLADSGVASNELLRAKIYPDSDDTAAPLGDGPDETYDRVEYRYNRLGEPVEMKDQNGTIHTYEYDKLGRLLHDKVTTVGTGIDDAILCISRGYDVRGMLQTVSSADAVEPEAARVVNAVRLEYNEFGQLVADYQAHDARLPTPAVRYTYANGEDNSIRPLSIIYPNGRTLSYSYGGEETIDLLRGRIHEIKEGEDTVVRYTHRGIKSTVRIEYIQPGLEMTYIKQAGEPDGDAGDQYTGLDRFGRIVDVRWLKTGSSPILDVDRFQYGFDRASNRTYRRNVLGSAAHYDELYSYDGLYQLNDLQRGTLNTGGTAVSDRIWQEDFTYDPTGNWLRYQTAVSGTPILDQTRTNNQVNEITSFTNPAWPVGYDAAGNMTVKPDTDQSLVWDAWNRLVQVKRVGGLVAEYSYDGLTRRIWKRTEGGVRPYRHFYYSDKWQVLEERLGASDAMERQFVWGLRYADDLVLRDAPDPLPEYYRLFATHDQWHCTGIADQTGEIVERFVYEAFGNPLALGADFGGIGYFYDWETRFGAYRWDTETEICCVRYRYLHPRIGRWISADPIEAQPARFSYVSNDPAGSVDVYGLTSKECCDEMNKYMGPASQTTLPYPLNRVCCGGHLYAAFIYDVPNNPGATAPTSLFLNPQSNPQGTCCGGNPGYENGVWITPQQADTLCCLKGKVVAKIPYHVDAHYKDLSECIRALTSEIPAEVAHAAGELGEALIASGVGVPVGAAVAVGGVAFAVIGTGISRGNARVSCEGRVCPGSSPRAHSHLPHVNPFTNAGDMHFPH